MDQTEKHCEPLLSQNLRVKKTICGVKKKKKKAQTHNKDQVLPVPPRAATGLC